MTVAFLAFQPTQPQPSREERVPFGGAILKIEEKLFHREVQQLSSHHSVLNWVTCSLLTSHCGSGMDLSLGQAGFMGSMKETWPNLGFVRKEEMENGCQVAITTTSFYFMSLILIYFVRFVEFFYC